MDKQDTILDEITGKQLIWYVLFRVSNLMHLFIISFYIPLHVSSHIVLIIRRLYCIYTASGSLCITLLG